MDSLKAVALPNDRDIIVELQVEQKRRDRLLFLVLCGIVVFITPLVVLAGINLGLSLLLAGVAVIGLTAVIARWPLAGFFVIAGCVVFIDQAPLITPVFTDSLYVYSWPTASRA